MNWGIGLEAVGLSNEDWGPSYTGTYQELADGWRSPVPLPSEADLLAAIDSSQGKRDALAELARLERLETPRRLAEAVLTVEGKTWLEANRALIAVERAKL